MAHYSQPDLSAFGGNAERAKTILITARGEWLAHCGKHLMLVAQPLAEAEKEAKLTRQPNCPRQRATNVARLMTGKFAKLETKMRAILVSHKLFKLDSLPTRRHVAATAPSPAAETAPSPDRTVRTVCALDSSDQTMALTDKAVFNRLRIKGVGEEVMALVDTDAEEDFCPTEDEFLPDVEAAPDAQPLGESAWHNAVLQRLELPHAHVQITTVITVPDEEGKDVAVKQKRVFKVKADNLAHSNREQEKKKTLHPSLQERGDVTMPPFNYWLTEEVFLENMVKTIVGMGVNAAQPCVKKVEVSRLSAQDKPPLVLQCRALEDFKTGHLMLIPGGAGVTLTGKGRAGDPTCINPDDKRKLKRKVHESMLSYAYGSIGSNFKDKRNAASKGDTTFELRSRCALPERRKASSCAM